MTRVVTKRIIVKFKERGDHEETLRTLLAGRLREINQIFPGDEEPSLATLYEVVVTGTAFIAIKLLTSNPSVEYAHEPSERKLA